MPVRKSNTKKLSLLHLVKYIHGASDQNRTGIPALARPCTNHCTTPATNIYLLYHKNGKCILEIEKNNKKIKV